MSRYRVVHCLIWNDDKFPFTSDEAKLVFFHLLTTPFSSPFGCYKAGLKALTEESRMDPKGYAKGFQECFQEGFIKYDETLFLILIPNFIKYNPPGNPNVVKSWGKLFKELPKSELLIEAYSIIEGVCKELGKGFAEAFSKAFRKPSSKGMANQDQDQYQDQEQDHIKKPLVEIKKPKTKKLSENQFEKFWEQYPKKVGKGAARKSFLNIKLGDSDPDQMLSTLMAAVKNQTQSSQWKKENGKFIPNPSTWINQERWQDEIEIPEYQTFPDPPPDWKNRFPTAESTEKDHDGLEGI